MVKFSALLTAVCFLTADAFRSDVKSEAVLDAVSNDTSGWNFDGVVLNPAAGLNQGPLIANMVPPPGTTFEVQNRERLDLLESNEYRWAFLSIQQNGQVTPISQWFATLQGGFFGNIFGARRTEVTNNHGVPLFAIEMAKYIWNPTRLSWSFRIRHPLTNEILYTVNKDWVGAGFLFLRDEWRVYRGRRRDHQQIYHVVGGYFGYGHRFYHEKREWRRGIDPIAEASQSVGRSLVGLPDVFSLKVHEGEDTALLLAATVIIDMVHESEAFARARESRNHERRGHSLLQLQEGSDESVWSEEAMAQAELGDLDGFQSLAEINAHDTMEQSNPDAIIGSLGGHAHHEGHGNHHARRCRPCHRYDGAGCTHPGNADHQWCNANCLGNSNWGACQGHRGGTTGSHCICSGR